MATPANENKTNKALIAEKVTSVNKNIPKIYTKIEDVFDNTADEDTVVNDNPKL
jgi:hypothetical protein